VGKRQWLAGCTEREGIRGEIVRVSDVGITLYARKDDRKKPKGKGFNWNVVILPCHHSGKKDWEEVRQIKSRLCKKGGGRRWGARTSKFVDRGVE